MYWPWVETCAQHNDFYPYPIFEQVGTKGRVGLFTTSALIMAANTMMLKALYEAVNGKLDEREEENVQSKKHGTPLDESSLPEAASGVARQVEWMAKGHTGGDDDGSEESEALDGGSVPEAAGGMARQADYMAKGMGIKD